MDGFNFYARRRGMVADNVFFGLRTGTNPTQSWITASYVETALLATIKKNFRQEGNIIKGYVYKENSGTELIYGRSFETKSGVGSNHLDYVIIDNQGLFWLRPVDGFEFYNTRIYHVWMPFVSNSLGREAFNLTSWRKRAYFPFVLSLGRRTFTASYTMVFTERVRIYTPSCTEITFDSFVIASGKNFNNVTLYLDYATWNGVSNTNLSEFLAAGGTLQLIQDYTKPTTPSDLVVTNITSTSIKVDFNVSTFTNAFGWYEVFCVIDNNPVSQYFHHKEIASNSATITGLPSGTIIEVKVRAADEYMNLSNFGNSVFITTL